VWGVSWSNPFQASVKTENAIVIDSSHVALEPLPRELVTGAD